MTSPSSEAPEAVYQRHRAAHRRLTDELQRRRDRLGQGRVAVVIAGVVLAIAVVTGGWLPIWTLAVPVVGLLTLSVVFARVSRRLGLHKRAMAFYDRGLARLEERWAGQGEAGTRYLTDSHLYAADLDLFGAGSLFERLCDARTRGGQDTLAAWLLAPASSDVIRDRQAAVADLRRRLGLREELALLGEVLPAGIDTTSLIDWAEAHSKLPQRWGRRLLDALTLLVGITILLTVIFWPDGLIPLAGALLLQGGFVLWHLQRTRDVLKVVERRARDLMELAAILARIERESFSSPHLQRLQASLKSAGLPPSRQLARLANLVDLLNARMNQFFWPFVILLMWGTRMAYSIEAWRRECGYAVRHWFGVIGEVEAFLSLAAFSFESPQDPFPEIVAAGPLYEASALGHPLIPRGQCICNDVTLGRELQLLVVSGSNMSGKSTFLRTVGVNAVLALAGGTVRADSLRLSPLAVGATLRIQDSLQAGKSRFYAEITRIQQIVETAKGPLPLLFLLDELLHGTNSHDRAIGAEAIVRALLDRGAVGLITTHDLTLAHIADNLTTRAANVHFADQLIDGKMIFDYQMRPGVVRHSNAIELMRAVGLPV
ncbi:MAG: MutS-related protein [Gemmataceae bacterium]